MQGIGQSTFRLHPALSRYLRARTGSTADDASAQVWQRGFVEVMAALADHYTPRPLHEQRRFFALYGANVEQARRLAAGGDSLKTMGC